VSEPSADELYVEVDDGERAKDATQGEHLLQGMELTENQAYASTQSPNVITVEPNQCYVTTTSQSGLNPDQLYVGVEDHFELTESQAYEAIPIIPVKSKSISTSTADPDQLYSSESEGAD
jgi:hypothetical protein